MSVRTFVISLGGSLVVPSGIDVSFLRDFRSAIKSFMSRNPSDRMILVVGGGATARTYQNAFREVNPSVDPKTLDGIGIMATRMNACVVSELFGYSGRIVTDPTAEGIGFCDGLMIACGWKPGFSTDMDAVTLAKRFGAGVCVNLSNIDMVHTADPKKDPSAKPLRDMTWAEFREQIVKGEWQAGGNYPFDPVASRFASENSLVVICANGRDMDNTIRILEGGEFVGTTIHP